MEEVVAVTWDREIHFTYHRLSGNNVVCQEMPFVRMKLEQAQALGIRACHHEKCLASSLPEEERAKQ